MLLRRDSEHMIFEFWKYAFERIFLFLRLNYQSNDLVFLQMVQYVYHWSLLGLNISLIFPSILVFEDLI